MAIFSPTESDNLQLHRLVFHVVGPNDDELRILPEIEPAQFAGLFLARLRESDSGNVFRFKGESETLSDLRGIHDDEATFVEGSERMAHRFQDLHSGRTSRGVFMVMHIAAGDERFFALVKYALVPEFWSIRSVRDSGTCACPRSCTICRFRDLHHPARLAWPDDAANSSGARLPKALCGLS